MIKYLRSKFTFIWPRIVTFRDWYKLVFPLSRLYKNKPTILHARKKINFYVRNTDSSDVNVIMDIVQKDEYNLKSLVLKDGEIVLDIGANIGVFTKTVLKYNEKVKVFSYEPDIENFNLLQKNLDDPSNAYRLAIASNDGFSELYSNSSQLTSTIVKGNVNPNIKNIRIQKVKNITLKSLLERFNRIHLMKMDIEGAEHDVIKNTPKELFKKIDRIIIEIHLHHKKYNSNITIYSLVDYINNLGFKVVDSKNDIYFFERIH